MHKYVPAPLPLDRERPSAAAHRTSDRAEHSLLREEEPDPGKGGGGSKEGEAER
ncbi:hypothetical protein DFH07DRAFT_957393 [Mycena maculata]|uniref:Uncharacterized protein n=1 Tax=Mycena maculata TaxID=230809 RepID=A0AAD7NI16_9AGAR|nr:hypothetical protein DFH07DRAFT_957393 [Mycena maculata]